MTHGRLIEELDLLAYADDLLDPARREEVENYLQQDLDAAQRVADYQAQNKAIRAAYGHVASEPPPTRLLATLHSRRPSSGWRRSLKAGAMAAALVASGFFGWSLNNPPRNVAQPSDALVEASRALHSDWSPQPATATDVAVEGSALLPKALAAEQEGELALRITPPDLSSLGLRLLGMRPTNSQGIEGAQIIYGDAQGERISLFLLPASGSKHSQLTIGSTRNGQLAYWRDGPIAFTLIGEDAGHSAQTVAAQVRGALRSAPILFLSENGTGLMAGPSSDKVGSLLENAPLLRPEPVSDNSISRVADPEAM